MIKNYIKIAVRNMAKNKIFSLINILGLSIGMAACLLIIQHVRFEWSYENFHKNAENIYRVTLDLYNGSEYVVADCETHGPLGPLLKDQMPEVVDFVRMYHNQAREVKVDNKIYMENRIYFADSSIFNVFSYDFLIGDQLTALTEPFLTVITKSIANKYFGRTDVVGQSIQFEDNDYKITAVIEDLPANTHLKFDFLLSHATINQIWDWYERSEWNGNNEYTYLLMAPGTNLQNFNQKLTNLSIALKDKIGDDRFVAEPVKDIHLYSHKTFEPEVNGNVKIVNFLTIISLLILIIAWVNYINLSTARAKDRSQEVGIRKVIGSVRRQLIFQFLFESVIMSILATVISIVLIFISLPVFRNITGQPLNLNIITDSVFWYIVLTLLFVGSVLSSLYPAMILSSFQPISVLKGKQQSSIHGNAIRKGLVVFQFTATVILIVCTCTVYLQIKHLRDLDLGMNIDKVLAIQAPHSDAQRSLSKSYKEEILRLPEVHNVAFSESLPGLSLHELSTDNNIRKVSNNNRQNNYNYYIVRVDEDYVPTMDIQLLAGRNFREDDFRQSQVIINEEAARLLGFANIDEAIGSKITYYVNGQPAIVIGVIKNYHQQSPKEPYLPMVFPYTNSDRYFSVRLSTNNIRGTINKMEKTWHSLFPNSVFSYFFIDDRYDQQYQSDKKFGELITIFSSLAIFIACLGLFGLATLIAQNRTKEIGIRKVNGAKVSEILTLLNKDFVKWVSIAILVATPVSWYIMSNWLNGFAKRIELSWWIFALAGVLALGIALLTVSWQSWRAATRNPVEALRYE